MKGDRTTSRVGVAHFQIHVNLVHAWKKLLLDGAAAVFTPAGKGTPPPDDAKQAELYEQIGRLQVELAFVKKKSPGVCGVEALSGGVGSPTVERATTVRVVGPEPIDSVLRTGCGRPRGLEVHGADRSAAYRRKLRFRRAEKRRRTRLRFNGTSGVLNSAATFREP